MGSRIDESQKIRTSLSGFDNSRRKLRVLRASFVFFVTRIGHQGHHGFTKDTTKKAHNEIGSPSRGRNRHPSLGSESPLAAKNKILISLKGFIVNELTGTIRALLDEYRKAINELIAVIKPLTRDEIVIVRDSKTANENCRSVQTILTHVVYAGYGYTNFIENNLGHKKERRPKQLFETADEYSLELNGMFDYCENFFIEHPNIKLEEYDPSKKILTHWGQAYDIDQIMEHAIVHVLKHRRQIQRFVSSQMAQA